MALIESKELAKYAWSNPDVTVDGDGYISPFTVENFAEEHAVDAAPVVHGRWINREGPDEDMNVTDQCSRCGHRDTHSPKVDVPYCWFCGARMWGEEDS